MDFLSEENVCGQSLLKLTSRGSAIIAEMLRLSDNVPRVTFPDTNSCVIRKKIDLGTLWPRN